MSEKLRAEVIAILDEAVQVNQELQKLYLQAREKLDELIEAEKAEPD